jgi:spore germination protein YaaH
VVIVVAAVAIGAWPGGENRGAPGSPPSSGPAKLAASPTVGPPASPDASGSPDASPGPGSSPAASPDASLDPSTASPAQPIGSAESPMSEHLSGDVYGYLPYWEMDGAIEPYLDWNALSWIALFSVGAGRDGSLLTTLPGYEAIASAQSRRIIATATSRGVRAEIVFSSFGLAKNAAFFADPAAQARTIGELRALVTQVGARGVNVDVESLSGTLFPAYATFCGRLRQALQKDDPTSTVTAATNGNLSGARMAKAALDVGVDRAFLMGYAYRSSGSQPGAIAPLDRRDSLTSLDLRRSLALYAAAGVPFDRLILGLPLYGMSWPTAGPNLGDGSTAGGTAFIPRRHLAELAANGPAIGLDLVESVDWYPVQDPATGAWTQVFLDTPRSLAPKLQLAIDQGLAGVGFWALGFDRGRPGYWDLVQQKFGPPRLIAVTAPARTRDLVVPVGVAAVAGSRPIAGVQLSSDGSAWAETQALPPAPAGAPDTDARSGLSWTIPGSRDGTYRAWVRLVDDLGLTSREVAVPVVLDRTGPRMSPTGPAVTWSQKDRRWHARWDAAADPSGIGGYSVRVRVGTRAWRVVTALTTSRSISLPGIARSASVRVAVQAVDRLGNWAPKRAVGRSR